MTCYMTTRQRRTGFTLVEILIVVVILGVLAAIVIPLFADASEDTQKIVFAANAKIFAKAAYLYMNDTGLLLEDSSSGDLPAGWDTYVDVGEWTSETPIGGVWDMEQNSFGMTSGFGVHFNGVPNPGDTYMQEIDRILDNGDLNTGGFRKIAGDRYYMVLMP